MCSAERLCKNQNEKLPPDLFLLFTGPSFLLTFLKFDGGGLALGTTSSIKHKNVIGFKVIRRLFYSKKSLSAKNFTPSNLSHSTLAQVTSAYQTQFTVTYTKPLSVLKDLSIQFKFCITCCL